MNNRFDGCRFVGPQIDFVGLQTDFVWPQNNFTLTDPGAVYYVAE